MGVSRVTTARVRVARSSARLWGWCYCGCSRSTTNWPWRSGGLTCGSSSAFSLSAGGGTRPVSGSVSGRNDGGRIAGTAAVATNRRGGWPSGRSRSRCCRCCRCCRREAVASRLLVVRGSPLLGPKNDPVAARHVLYHEPVVLVRRETAVVAIGDPVSREWPVTVPVFFVFGFCRRSSILFVRRKAKRALKPAFSGAAAGDLDVIKGQLCHLDARDGKQEEQEQAADVYGRKHGRKHGSEHGRKKEQPIRRQGSRSGRCTNVCYRRRTSWYAQDLSAMYGRL